MRHQNLQSSSGVYTIEKVCCTVCEISKRMLMEIGMFDSSSHTMYLWSPAYTIYKGTNDFQNELF